MKILLCSLSDALRVPVAQALAGPENQLIAADDPSEAVALFALEAPAIALVGGASCAAVADTCRRLRAAEAERNAVIVAAASDSASDVQAVIEAGADDYFVEALGEVALRSRLVIAVRAARGARSHRETEHGQILALRQLIESLTTTLESIGDGVVATDLTGAIVRMNSAAERLSGWTLAEVEGRSLREVMPLMNGDTRARLESPIDHAFRENCAVSLLSHTLLTRRDGSELVITDSCAPIRAPDGTTSGAVLVFRDLTAQRAAEALEAKSQKQIVFADRMASVGTLAAGIAHEINNPLTYVGANVDMAIEEIRRLRSGSALGRSTELDDMLRDALEGVARVTKIVRGLKTFSRVEEERPRPVELAPIIDLAISMASSELHVRAKLVKSYGTTPLVDADEARLGQVFINLLVNAAQAMSDTNKEKNEIGVVTSTNEDGRALVEVRDNGGGIPPALLSRVFDPFFTTKAVGEGTGLGLAISHSIVTGMGGELTVTSEVGRGTCFTVLLPPSRGVALPLPRVEPPTTEKPQRVVKVLVIDDEPAVGVVLSRVLRGHRVTVVGGAELALALLASGHEFDIVLSDLMMPNMSGIDFYRTLVKTHPKMAPRVVFLTGGAFTTEARQFLDGVANECVEKPFDSRSLRELVERFAR